MRGATVERTAALAPDFSAESGDATAGDVAWTRDGGREHEENESGTAVTQTRTRSTLRRMLEWADRHLGGGQIRDGSADRGADRENGESDVDGEKQKYLCQTDWLTKNCLAALVGLAGSVVFAAVGCTMVCCVCWQDLGGTKSPVGRATVMPGKKAACESCSHIRSKVP